LVFEPLFAPLALKLAKSDNMTFQERILLKSKDFEEYFSQLTCALFTL
jgi:hypothetical protein